jgi:hypothetical protein
MLAPHEFTSLSALVDCSPVAPPFPAVRYVPVHSLLCRTDALGCSVHNPDQPRWNTGCRRCDDDRMVANSLSLVRRKRNYYARLCRFKADP